MGWKVKRRERHALIEVDEVNPLVHRGTFHIGPRHVKHHASKEFVEHAYVENPPFASERNCRVFAQSSNIAVEVYDFYNKLFDPDYENVSVHDERFEVQYLFKEKPKETWRSVDYYNPRIEVIPLDDGVDIKKVFDTDYGPETLEITYTVKTGARLKHTIVFTNKTAQQRTFRVVMKFSGITSDKVKHGQVEERITEEKHIVAPTLIFGEDNQRLKLSEYLWSLGETDEETMEWSPTTLKDIVLDVHAQGCKADIIIGNYVLAENESLLIDPDTDTFYEGHGYDDAHEKGDGGFDNVSNMGYAWAHTDDTHFNYRCGGFRFCNVTIPQGSDVSAAKVTVWVYQYAPNDANLVIYGNDVDNALDFNDLQSIISTGDRPRTDASVSWVVDDIPDNRWQDKTGLEGIVEEIVGRGGWSSGNAIVLLFIANTDVAKQFCFYSYDREGAGKAPRIEVTWTSVVVPTVTTQAADDISAGAGTLHGTITATGGENADERGFDWDYDSGAPYAFSETDTDSFGVGVFEEALTGLTQGNTVYFRAKAHNSAGWGYGGELSFVVRKAITRSASAAIGVTGVSGRGFVGTRTSVASLSVVATAARSQILTRVASAAIALVGTPGRILAAFRSASAALGLVAVTSRILHAIRSAGAATNIVAITNRVLSASRSASANMSIEGTANRSWIGTRVASAALGISAIGGSIKAFVRTASASIGVVGTADRSWIGTRSAEASMDLEGTADRSWIGSRSAPANMSVVGTSARVLHSIRSAAASISQVATAARSGIFTRSASGDIAVTGTASRMLAAFRSAGAAISSVAAAKRSQVLVRTQSASMGLTAVSGRTLAAFRGAAASVGMVGTAVRKWIGSRTASASVAIVGTPGRMLSAFRSTSASIGLTAATKRIVNNVRSAAASMNIVAVGSFFKHILKGIVTLRFAGKTRILDFVDKERNLRLSARQRVLDLADKIRKLKFGRKET